MTNRVLVFAATGALLALGQTTLAQPFSARPFQADSYTIQLPADWSYKPQTMPDGSQLHMFFGPKSKAATPYCHIAQSPTVPLLGGDKPLTDKQRAQLYATGGQDLLFSLYDNVASAKSFRYIHSNVTAVSGNIPSFTADFVFGVPQGFFYRVRSHYASWKGFQLTLWCQTVARSEVAAEDEFLRNLATFQAVSSSLKIAR